MTVVIRADILSSLQSVRDDVQRQIAELDRYRALKAIEQTIADFPGLEDLGQSLSEIREQVQQQLDNSRECRALRTIERVMPELSEVLALLAERSAGEARAEEAPSEPDVEQASGPEQPVADERAEAAPEIADARGPVVMPMGGPTATEQPRSMGPAEDIRGDDALVQSDRNVPDHGDDLKGLRIPSLADSVAQLMAQSISPLPLEAQTPTATDAPDGSAEIVLRPPPQAEQAA